MSAPNYPSIVTRTGKGSPLTTAEMDANFTGARAYALLLANILATSLNPDGSFVPGSVGATALQAAAVTLASLNPSLLYSIIPVDTDAGAQNAYAITARGGLGGTNLITGSPVYDANGNYVLNGLTLNYGYYWTKNASGSHDSTVVADYSQTLSASGAFTATATSVTLTGTPNATVTASVALSAPISSYKDNQIFFVYTLNANTAASTLNVNGLGAIPILLNGLPLTPNSIGAGSFFSVLYKNGAFVLFGGNGSGGGGDLNISYTFQGQSQFTSGSVALPGSGLALILAHGFGGIPEAVTVTLKKIAADSTTPAVGQILPVTSFLIGTAQAFTVSFDATNITVLQNAGTIALDGVNITAASWNLIVTATKVTNISSNVFPALTYQLATPEGALSYGDTLMGFSYGAVSGKVSPLAINLTNNRVIPLTPGSSAQMRSINGAVFKRTTTGSGVVAGAIEGIYNASTGIYRVPMVSPQANIVPRFQTYDTGGLYVLTVTSGATYTWTIGTNDISYDNGGGYVTTASFTAAGATITLKGNPGASVTATVAGTAAWAAAKITGFTNNINNGTKPVQIAEAAGVITDVWMVGSNFDYSGSLGATATINAVPMIKYTSAGGGLSNIGSVLNLTTATIVGIAEFNKWYALGSTAKVMLFQYNNITKRIYVITNENNLLHIFKITAVSNDIAAWWVSATRYADLTYVKSIALSGDGAMWSVAGKCNYFVEFDFVSGAELAVVQTRDGNPNYGGSVTRVPWVEG